MAFAALEAMEELDLFGIHGGGPASKIHVSNDEAQKVLLTSHNVNPFLPSRYKLILFTL